jgi:predicted nucleotide-binding protein
MQDEAVITINGVKLTDAESMTVRVAVDTLANVLAEGMEEKEGQELSAVYVDSLVRIQALLERPESRKQ